MTRFQLDIELGNDAMQSPDDVARALRTVANALDDCDWHGCHPEQGLIRDMNGNMVGRWVRYA